MEIIYKNKCVYTNTHTRQMLIILLHVSTRHTCSHQEVLSIANAAPSKWHVAQKGGYIHNHTCTRVKPLVQTLEYRRDKC